MLYDDFNITKLPLLPEEVSYRVLDIHNTSIHITTWELLATHSQCVGIHSQIGGTFMNSNQ